MGLVRGKGTQIRLVAQTERAQPLYNRTYFTQLGACIELHTTYIVHSLRASMHLASTPPVPGAHPAKWP